MTNLNTIEKLRTRKEVEDYFKQLGKEITEEELDALKQSYDKAQESSGALTMQQLDDVAGGIFAVYDKVNRKVGFNGEISLTSDGKVRCQTGGHVWGYDGLNPNVLLNVPSFSKTDKGLLINHSLFSERSEEDSKRILGNPNFIPIINLETKRVSCYPINVDEIASGFGVCPPKDFFSQYSSQIGAEFIINQFPLSKLGSSITDYDKDQLENLRKLVEAAKQPMPPAPSA